MFTVSIKYYGRNVLDYPNVQMSSHRHQYPSREESFFVVGKNLFFASKRVSLLNHYHRLQKCWDSPKKWEFQNEESCVLFQVTKTFFGTKRVRLSLGIPRKISSLHLKATRILIWPSVGSCRSRSERKSCF